MKKEKHENIKLLLVDFPYLVYMKKQYNLYELFSKLSKEFEEIKCFIKYPRDKLSNGDKDYFWGLVKIPTVCGVFPTLYPSDVDPFLVTEIYRSLKRKEITTIGILTGDQGYYSAIQDAKRFGKRIKIIIDDNFNYYLLRAVADEIATISDYTELIESGYHSEFNMTSKSIKVQTKCSYDNQMNHSFNEGE